MKWKLALFQALKHKRRMILILFSVMVSVSLMEILTAMGEGMREHFYSDLLKDSGHVQIVSPDWQKRISDTSLKYLLSGASDLAEAVKHDPDVLNAEAILQFNILLHTPNKDLFAEGVGLDSQRLDSGFFPGIPSGIREGRLPTEDSDLALSKTIAGILNVKPGDALTLIGTKKDGSPALLSMKVCGIYSTALSLNDENLVFLHLPLAGRFLGTGSDASAVRITLNDRNKSETKAEFWRQQYPDKTFRVWQKIFADMLVFMKLFDVFMGGINLVFCLVAATIILNTVLMNVLERSGEFGTMRAMGLRKSVLRGLILREGILLGLVGTVAGILAALPLDLYIQAKGLVLGAMTESVLKTSVYHFRVIPLKSLFNGAFGLLIAVLAYWYSARTMTRTPITSSLSKNVV